MIFLRSDLRRKLLAYVYVNRRARFFVREMARTLGVDSTNLSRELSRLEREGFLRSEVEGRQRYYQVNTQYPYLKAVFSLLRGSVGVVPTLKHVLERVPRIESAHLYGSFAKSEEDAESDIDVLIIGEPNGASLAAAVSKLEKSLGREVNYTVFKQQELMQRLSEHDAFLSDVWRGERIQLIGNEQDQAASA